MWGQRFVERADELFKLFDYEPEKLTHFKSIRRGGTCEEIFSAVWDMREVHQIMEPTLVSSGKSETEATRLRNEGNAYYKMKNFEKALQLYNLSIMSAPHPVLRVGQSEASKCNITKGEKIDPFRESKCKKRERCHPFQKTDVNKSKDSEALALGYANRSAIMFELGVYEMCIEDIDMALKYDYPDKRKVKLNERKQRCLDAKAKIINTGSGGDDQNQRVREKFSKLEKEEKEEEEEEDKGERNILIDSARKTISLKTLLLSPEKKTPLLKEPNKKYPALSNALEVSYAPAKGRCLMATRDIRTGEVLGVERAHSVSLDSDKLPNYCSFCLRFSPRPFPCPTCQKVTYCSESCLLSSLTDEHWLECAILPSLIQMELSANKNLAYKIMRGIPYSSLNCLLNTELQVETQKVCPEDLGVNDAGIYSSESYEAISTLCSNVELFDFRGLFMHCLVALVITKLLQKCGRFFVSAEGDAFEPSDDKLIKTGGLLLSYLLKVQKNCYGIDNAKERIGAGIYPTLSLVNHSCNPSAKHYSRGRVMVLRAVRPIAAGEEVTISYTPDYSDNEAEKRRKHLVEKYHFLCECDACHFEWQTVSKLPELLLKCFRCTQSVGGNLPVCYNCRLEYKNKSGYKDRIRFETLYTQVNATFLSACKIACKLMRDESISEEEYESLCEAAEFIHKHIAMPCQVIYNMERILEKCFTIEQ